MGWKNGRLHKIGSMPNSVPICSKRPAVNGRASKRCPINRANRLGKPDYDFWFSKLYTSYETCHSEGSAATRNLSGDSYLKDSSSKTRSEWQAKALRFCLPLIVKIDHRLSKLSWEIAQTKIGPILLAMVLRLNSRLSQPLDFVTLVA